MRPAAVRIIAVSALFAIAVFACAKRPASPGLLGKAEGVKMSHEARTFRGLAYITAEKGGVKWANPVSVVIRQPGGLRMEAIEKITDVVARLVVLNGKGHLYLPLEDKTYPIENGNLRLPQIGEMNISTDVFTDILSGVPIVEGGATVTEAFHTDRGSYFIRGRVDEMEMSAKEGMPLVFTHFSSPDKKKVVFEASFDDFKEFGGRKFPQHIVVRFMHPKLLMEIRYKDINVHTPVPLSLFETNEE